ncbi:MAG: DUF1614 domain-containing protein [Calditrichaeota bacterium]|nr:MAG: DUF1614 domain-containing protein [Calditrichota bacterium]
MFFLPFVFFFFLFYLGLLALLFFVIQIEAIEFAFQRIGIPGDMVFTVLLLSLLGSGINIPVKHIVSRQPAPAPLSRFLSWKFPLVAPVVENQTIIAVNVGGAVIPTLIALYLMFSHPGLLLQNLVAVIIVSLIIHRLARPIPRVGIATPALLPPLLAALVAELLGGTHQAPLVAYVSGTLGTLIGADLMNLKRIPELGAPVASIGGAGTYDGVFLTGIVAVLLASL